ncbi:hypothetical protein BKA70DRAFT_1157439 [Coprinopsis sp. MPI-PUGE-AT-0042]|nr:hypothetical protein BKA70DRAFT_1157439 [Coprinopsis sp. MPI-PUGE-AT-0042]
MASSNEDLNTAGRTYAASQFASTALGIALLAVQAFMVLYGLSAFLGTPKAERKGRLRFIIISWIILLTSSVDTIIDLSAAYRVLYSGGPTGKSYMEVLIKEANESPGAVTGIASDAMLLVCIAVGDVLMLWRCFILWKERKWIVALPILTCIGTIVSYSVSLASRRSNTRSIYKAVIASTSLSVATNLLVTCLILYRLILARFDRRRTFPNQRSPRVYSSIMAILVESATPLAFFGILYVIATSILLYHQPEGIVQVVNLVAFSDIVNWLYFAFCALSPQMIIFRVTTGTSWKNEEGVITLSKPIQFADTATKDSNLADSV